MMAHFAPSVQDKLKSTAGPATPFSYVGCRPLNPSFHLWSRHERALFRAQRQMKTEHWTKMRCRSYGAMKLGSRVWIPFEVEDIDRRPPEGMMDPVGSVALEEYLRKCGMVSKDLDIAVKKRPPKSIQTKSSERAKLGFRYWYLDPLLHKRKPELKMNIGAPGTYFGISFPR